MACDVDCPYWEEAHGNVETIVCPCGRYCLDAGRLGELCIECRVQQN